MSRTYAKTLSTSRNYASLVQLVNFLAEKLDFYASENRALWSLILGMGPTPRVDSQRRRE